VALVGVPDGYYFADYSTVSPIDHVLALSITFIFATLTPGSTSCSRKYRMAIHQEMVHLNISTHYMYLGKLQSLMPVMSANSSGIYSAYVMKLF